jgi:hypothetical protein
MTKHDDPRSNPRMASTRVFQVWGMMADQVGTMFERRSAKVCIVRDQSGGAREGPGATDAQADSGEDGKHQSRVALCLGSRVWIMGFDEDELRSGFNTRRKAFDIA